jgi:hypothetical protein
MALLDEWLAEDRAPMEGGELPDEEPLEIPPFSLREVPVE